ncbi:MAG: GDSL-type esterase/lipase family protein [Lentisphaerales bacterium]|nr:GDSL-type esterase/lipase family protein [Lentisphaerales bacterium]
MLRVLLVCALALVNFSCQSNYPDYKTIKGKKVLFLGDSITNNGLYVSYIENGFFHKQLNVDVISIGLSSETASGLSEKEHPFPRPCIHSRLDKALKMIKPDIVVACYGMNDGIYHPLNRSRTLAYQIGVKQLLDKAKRAGAQVILMTPPPFDPKPIAEKTKPKSFNNFSYQTPYEGYNEVLSE